MFTFIHVDLLLSGLGDFKLKSIPLRFPPDRFGHLTRMPLRFPPVSSLALEPRRQVWEGAS